MGSLKVGTRTFRGIKERISGVRRDRLIGVRNRQEDNKDGSQILGPLI